MTYGNIQSLLQGMMPGASTGFISTSGSPSELAYYLRMVHMELAGGPHKFSWALREYTLTLVAGQTEYNLKTLIPDLVQIYQISGDQIGGYEMGYRPLREQNITRDGVTFTVMGSTLRLTNPPSSGTLTIPYYSNYLVLDADGTTRKLDFEDADDESIAPAHLDHLLIEGTLRFYQRKEKEPILLVPTPMWDGKVVNLSPFDKFYWMAVQADAVIKDPVYDFRYSP